MGKSEVLLTRDDFRGSVFARDGHKCVHCNEPGADAHHIIERRLFSGPTELGGYFLDNGATVCSECHLRCESTEITCEQIRSNAGITKVVLPEHLYSDTKYDKWSNVYLEDGRRIPGELFYDESVQKVLGHVLHEFDVHVKYPRTYHLPWSPGGTEDDRTVRSGEGLFGGREVVVTVKMDGENTTMYRDHVHARSIESKPHPSRNWIRNFHAGIAQDIGPDLRLCGENLFARHSITYEDLESYFVLFSVWKRHTCLSWDETVEYAELFSVPTVPVVYEGVYDEARIRSLGEDVVRQGHEGYVVRLRANFEYRNFRDSVAKYVRADHVQTTHGFMTRAVVQNQLRPSQETT